jgi:predicted PurR-regulated permease PerM
LLTDSRPYTFDRVVRMILTAALIAALVWVAHRVRGVLIPLAVAFLLAYLLNPVVGLVQRWIKNRVAAVLTTVGVSLIIVLIAAAVLLPMIAAEVTDFGRVLMEALNEQSNLARWAREHLPEDIAREVSGLRNSDELKAFLQSPQFEALRQGAQSASGLLMVVLRWTMASIWGVVSGLFSLLAGIVGLFIVVLYLVFLLIDYRAFQDKWKDYLPPKQREGIVEFLTDFNAAMSRYFRGQFLVAACVGILFAIGFQILGLKLGIVLGLFIGLLNMVPYLQTIGIAPAVVLAAMTAFEKNGSLLWYLIGVAVVFVVVQTIQDTLLTPRIMGKVTGLRPAVILFSLLFWGKLLGMLGLVLAIPLSCLGLAYYRRLLTREEEALRAATPDAAREGDGA